MGDSRGYDQRRRGTRFGICEGCTVVERVFLCVCVLSVVALSLSHLVDASAGDPVGKELRLLIHIEQPQVLVPTVVASAATAAAADDWRRRGRRVLCEAGHHEVGASMGWLEEAARPLRRSAHQEPCRQPKAAERRQRSHVGTKRRISSVSE